MLSVKVLIWWTPVPQPMELCLAEGVKQLINYRRNLIRKFFKRRHFFNAFFELQYIQRAPPLLYRSEKYMYSYIPDCILFVMNDTKEKTI